MECVYGVDVQIFNNQAEHLEPMIRATAHLESGCTGCVGYISGNIPESAIVR